eukprot:7171750-Prymnesium_polylepis.1
MVLKRFGTSLIVPSRRRCEKTRVAHTTRWTRRSGCAGCWLPARLSAGRGAGRLACLAAFCALGE